MSSIGISRSLLAFGLFSLVGCGGGGMADVEEEAMWDETFPTFAKQTIAEFDGGSYAVCFRRRPGRHARRCSIRSRVGLVQEPDVG